MYLTFDIFTSKFYILKKYADSIVDIFIIIYKEI